MTRLQELSWLDQRPSYYSLCIRSHASMSTLACYRNGVALFLAEKETRPSCSFEGKGNCTIYVSPTRSDWTQGQKWGFGRIGKNYVQWEKAYSFAAQGSA